MGLDKMSRLGSQILASVLVNAVYEMKNYPVVLINTMLAPLSFLILIFFVSGGKLLGEDILGGLIMTMFQSGASLQADLSHLKNNFRLQEMVVGSPTCSSVYVSGMAISELIYSSPSLLILSILFALYIHVSALQVVGIIIVLFLIFLASVALSFAFATISSDIVQSFAFSRLITTLFSTIAPVYYPITLIPEPYRYIAYLSPTTYAAQISHHLGGLTQVSMGVFAFDWVILLAFTALFLWVGIKGSRWREV